MVLVLCNSRKEGAAVIGQFLGWRVYFGFYAVEVQSLTWAFLLRNSHGLFGYRAASFANREKIPATMAKTPKSM